MNEKRTRSDVMLCATIVLMLLLIAYVGSYYYFVEPLFLIVLLGPNRIGEMVSAAYPELQISDDLFSRPVPDRWYQSDHWVEFFAPINWLDRRIRSTLWQTE